jgi:predicted SnoaL-like aldol condensation-catalyzing enzyme
MRISSIHCLFGTTALRLVSFSQASVADDAVTAGTVDVREFYTTVLINRDVDAAPRFLRPDYIEHNPNVPTGLNGFMDTFRARFAQPLPADYKHELLNIVAENDLVVIYVRQTWTSKDGKHHQALGFDVFRVQDGKCRTLGRG